MKRDATSEFMLLSPADCWASWDFYPSPWNGGTLIVNREDDPEAAFVAYAAPGVSLDGEVGLATGHWRRAEWPSLDAFLSHETPDDFALLEVVDACAELPEDFKGWATRATAAHIDRLHSFARHRPERTDAPAMAKLLRAQLEEVAPGALEGCCEEVEARASLRERLHDRRPAAVDAGLATLRRVRWADLSGQLAVIGALYAIYHGLIREPRAPSGAEIGFEDLLYVPVGKLVLWFYGTVHVVLPVAFLVWVYLWRHDVFARARNALIVAAAISGGAYVIYSPDAVYASTATEAVPSGALPTMPALHLAVAIWLGFFGAWLSRSRVAKLCWAGYPLVVVGLLLASDPIHLPATIGVACFAATVATVLAMRTLPRLRPLGRLRRLSAEPRAEVRG